MKSYYNAGNHQFYDNLHKRYFDRAKAKAEHDGFASMFGDKRKGANRSPSEDNSNENCSLTLSRSRSKGINRKSQGRKSPFRDPKILS